MKDEVFSISGSYDEMGMSGSSVSRKLLALTNQSPSDFIQEIRLKRAASLLQNHFGTVTDIAFEVGFNNNPAYFSMCFKKMYGASPHEFSKL